MSKFTRILSIDGGGIRGIIPGQILVLLEEKLQKRTGNPEARIADFFDFIAGTSTGGILTCIYLCPDPQNPGRPRFTAQEAVEFYLQRGKRIFSRTLWQKIRSLGGIIDEKYSAEPLEKLLANYFLDLKLSQLLKPCLIPAYDIQKRRAYFFTQHDAVADDKSDFLVRDVARATSAAPTFFEVAKVTSLTNNFYPFIDGGVFANNPALCAYAEVRTKLKDKLSEADPSSGNPAAKTAVLLSLGTGNIKERYEYEKAKDWGKIQWVRPVINITMTGVAETVDFQTKQVFYTLNKQEQYLRINPVIRNNSPMAVMDNTSDENLNTLSKFGAEIAQNYSKKLDEFIEFLL
ncbi:MAG: patatin-like phospholipase family protein [Oscillatoria princeps RMCB-10]|jgi:patatin-like phospholipase/acyl hydrolase|nr:patatin-like phospholipase family protein [Oscillatoria princeps RMCB-10]